MKQQQNRAYPITQIPTFPNVKCSCGCEIFLPIYSIKHVPYLYAGNDGTMEIMPTGFMCANADCMKSYPNPTELLSPSPSQEPPQENQIVSSAL